MLLSLAGWVVPLCLKNSPPRSCALLQKHPEPTEVAWGGLWFSLVWFLRQMIFRVRQSVYLKWPGFFGLKSIEALKTARTLCSLHFRNISLTSLQLYAVDVVLFLCILLFILFVCLCFSMVWLCHWGRFKHTVSLPLKCWYYSNVPPCTVSAF